MLNNTQKADLITLVGLCTAMNNSDKLVEFTNKQIQEKRKHVVICAGYSTSFVLNLNEEGDYISRAVIDSKTVDGIDGRIFTSFALSDFIRYMTALKQTLPENWEENLRRQINRELAEAEIKYHRSFWGKLNKIEIKGKHELTKLFDMVVYEGEACYGKCAKYDITPWCYFKTNTIRDNSLASSVTHDTWFRYALSFYGQNGSLSKKDMGYHINLLSIGITKIITESMNCIKL